MSSEQTPVVLVTGGAGYIGSHTVLELLNANFQVLVLDNYVNSAPEAIARVESVSGRKLAKLYEGDVRDRELLKRIFSENNVTAVIHFAALKAVGDSVREPLRYYDNNVGSAIALLDAMRAANCRKFVFSSSATVYGDSNPVPFREDMPLAAVNPYGETKLAIEMLLRAMAKADAAWQFTLLRYFNPIGAHPSGLIGDDPSGVPNNLLPFVEQVAVGTRPKLTIFGNAYDTPDGTCVRDYIHVVDLALGHVAALNHSRPGAEAYNLGTSRGNSVLEVVHAFERVNGVPVPFEFGPPRAGDIAQSFADCSKAAKLLNFTATRTLDDMVASAWKWRSLNPNGLRGGAAKK